MPIRTHSLRSLLNHPGPPAALLAALIAFGGCATPSYQLDTNAYLSNPRLTAAYQPTRPGAVYVGPLGLRRPRAEGDLRVDVLLSGSRAFELARDWTDAPRLGGTANAVLSLRRVTPDAAPLNLTFTGKGVVATPLGPDGKELYRGIGLGDERILLTLVLESSPSFTPGQYELALLLPQGRQTVPWSIGDATIELDQRPLGVVMTETGRVEPQMIMGMP